MNTHLPELENTAEKYQAAVAALERINAQRQTAQDFASERQRNAAEKRERLAQEKTQLAVYQAALSEALFANQPVEDLQQKVTGTRANLEALQSLLARAEAGAAAADKAIMNSSAGLNQAQSEVDQTRFLMLTVRLAAAIRPAIPICRELWPLSHQLGVSLAGSGFVLDLSRPQIGRYTVADNGQLSFFLR